MTPTVFRVPDARSTSTLPSQPAHRRRHRLLASVAALLLATWVPLSPALGAGDAPRSPKRLSLKSGSFDPVLEPSPLPERLRRGAFAPGETGIYVVQLETSATPAFRAAIEDAGGMLLDYVPEHAYVVRLPAARIDAIRALPAVRFAGPLDPGHKLSPELGVRPFRDPSRRLGGEMKLTVELFPGGLTPAGIAGLVEASGGRVEIDEGDRLRLIVRGTRAVAEKIAALTDVRFIAEVGELTYRNDGSSWVVQSNQLDVRSIWNRGITGQGQIVGVIDGVADMNSCYLRDDVDNNPGPGHRKVVAYRSSTGQGANSHGTHVSGTVAGDQFPINGSTTNNGIAYEARISFENSNDVTGIGGGVSNLYSALASAFNDGARVHTNSWGDDGTTAYTPLVADIDAFSYDFEDSLVLFAETNTSTLRAPENSKNVLAVGASRNNGLAEQFCSGGRGPTADGRRKPEIFAPGCSIQSASSGVSCGTRGLTGTSMASPAVAGAAALVRQYFVDGFYPGGTASPSDALTPSGALMKGVLLNSAVDMASFSSAPPNDDEGWGRVLLDNALHFPGEPRKLAVIADLRNADGLASGEELAFPLDVVGDSENLKVTLVFTEPAGSVLASDPVVNDLDLLVEGPGGTYLGNALDSSGFSITGGSRDDKNNVEQVVVASPPQGTYTVTVIGAGVNLGRQGFALIATGDVTPTTGPYLAYGGGLVDDASPNGNGDGVLDPGETAALEIDLRNVGLGNATLVGATMTTDRPDLLKITRPGASFPDIPKGTSATSLAPHFLATLEPAAACGTPVTVTLATSSAEVSGDASFLLDIGRRDAAASGPGVTMAKKGTVTSDAGVAESFTVEGVEVTVDITHDDIGELIVELQSPTGTVVRLHDGGGAGTANLAGTYGAGLRPAGPGSLADFAGEAAQGTWTLSIQDTTAGPVAKGTLNAWSLALRADAAIDCSPLACGDPVPAAVGASLLVEKDGSGQLLFSWGAVAGASGYRVWSSDAPQFDQEAITGESSTTGLTAGPFATQPGIDYYRVRAVNSCNWEGP